MTHFKLTSKQSFPHSDRYRTSRGKDSLGNMREYISKKTGWSYTDLLFISRGTLRNMIRQINTKNITPRGNWHYYRGRILRK